MQPPRQSRTEQPCQDEDQRTIDSNKMLMLMVDDDDDDDDNDDDECKRGGFACHSILSANCAWSPSHNTMPRRTKQAYTVVPCIMLHDVGIPQKMDSFELLLVVSTE
eukprot:4822515-Amphidinium_carterae.1